MDAKYDTIGLNYADLRKADPRIAERIDNALGAAVTVLNVGAGAGSYEPTSREITAIEPSSEMIAQRSVSKATVMEGHAEHLPFEDNSFDASMAILTIHHWTDQAKGVSEMRRVTKGNMVFLTHDPAFRGTWLLDYFPEVLKYDDGKMPTMAQFRTWLGDVDVSIVPVPHDCTDGFFAGYWRRPEAYLHKEVREAISLFWALGDITDTLSQLEQDLEDGTWEKKYGHLLDLDALDCGYRLVTSA